MNRKPTSKPFFSPEQMAAALAALKASGKGWQTRVNDAMREWVKSHTQA